MVKLPLNEVSNTNIDIKKVNGSLCTIFLKKWNRLLRNPIIQAEKKLHLLFLEKINYILYNQKSKAILNLALLRI